MIDREALYAKLPIPLQNWAVALEGRRLRWRRFNAEFHEMLARYRQRETYVPEKIRAWRDRRIREFVGFAAATVPYYRQLFRESGIDAAQVRSLEDLKHLPVLTRHEVQADPRRFVPDASLGPLVACHTSGSTGAGLHIPATWRAQREQYAVWWRYNSWHGLNLDMPCLYLGGRSVVPMRQQHPPFWRYNRAGRQVLFSSYHLDSHTASAYLGEMRCSGATWLHGYPSMVALLANYALQQGERLALRWVTLGAENVLPYQAEAIRAAFGVVPREHYGMTEAVANISQCPEGALHVDEDFAAVEFLPVGGDQYRIIGTNFSNPAFPLIRYETGDLATLTDATCNCGRPGRVVDRLDGRQEDYVVTRRGAQLGRLDHIFKDMINIREAQIRQSKPGHMTLHVVRGSRYGQEDEQRLNRETVKRVGNQIDFKIEYVETLPRTAQGKLRFVVSDVGHEFCHTNDRRNSPVENETCEYPAR